MSDNLAMAAQLAGQSLRFGWYFALNRALDWRTDRLGNTPRYRPARPVPSLQELLAAQAQLLVSDALNVREGLYPAMDDDPAPLPRHLARVRQMFLDLPQAYARRAQKDATTVRAEPNAAQVPDYYAQDFHFQTGGYLTEGSARLYDVQVETLFMGSAGPMRRSALAPIAHFMAGSVTLRKTCNAVAPRLVAACSCSTPISSRIGTTSRIISGRATNAVAITMPGMAKATWKPALSSVGPNQPVRPP